tara:strand:+ start:1709 stop:2212 length:504 start_codon:yes stop_codon:yes gene_type:complete
VVRQSGPPSALVGARQVVVAVDYQSLTVGSLPVTTYLDGLAPDRRAAVEEVLQAMGDAFIAELTVRLAVPVVPATAPPAPGEVRVTARFQGMVMGKYAVVYAQDSRLITALSWSVGPTPTDEVQTDVFVPADVTRPAILQRMQLAAGDTAALAAEFFRREQTRAPEE